MPEPKEKPQNVEEYLKWLRDSQNTDISPRTRVYYESVVNKLKADFSNNPFWLDFIEQWNELHQSYQVKTSYPLFLDNLPPKLLVKPYDSFIHKTFRKNVVQNKNWPDPPQKGWLLPTNWFTATNDLVRTLVVVKYLDGVNWLIDYLKKKSEEHHIEGSNYFEARDDGYYAAHFYLRLPFEIPQESWDTVKVNVNVEIQVTTQLQEVIRKSLHEHYEKQRAIMKPERQKWQWDYRGEDFSANYLGHILHYLEGTILEIRDNKQKGKI